MQPKILNWPSTMHPMLIKPQKSILLITIILLIAMTLPVKKNQ